MLEMVKRRPGGLPESEAAFFLRQVLAGVEYMQAHNVIHRDLKLGNLFLSRRMAIKIGDFGLATVISTESDRKRCETNKTRKKNSER